MTGLERLQRAAADPNQPAWRLRVFAQEDALKPIVARNPSIDLPLVMELAADHPGAVAENPGLVLSAVADPSFLKTLDQGLGTGREQLKPVLELLVAIPDCPAPVVDYAITNARPALYRALLCNPALTVDQLLRMEAIVRERRMSGVRIRDIRSHVNHPKAVSSDPLAALLEHLTAASLSYHALRKAVESGALPPSVERCLIDSDPVPLLPYCHDAELVAEATRSDSVQLREAAAAAPALSAEGVRLLAADPDKRVREEVAKRHDLPADVATLLARDDTAITRKVLSRNAHLPGEALDILVEDPAVWKELAANPAAQERHLDRITANVALADTHSALYAACAHRNLSAGAIRRIYQAKPKDGALTALAGNPNTPVELLADLARQEHSSMRGAVALNPSTPLKLLEELRDDPEPAVRRSLMRRGDLPRAWVEAYASDPHILVRDTARLRLDRLDNPEPRAEADPNLYEHLIREQDRPLMACVRNLKDSTYELLAADKNTFTRLALALNPSIPASVREKLANDPLRLVRDALAVGAKAREA